MAKKLTISQAAKYLGISPDTLRRWDKSGKLSSFRSPSGYRLYSLKELEGLAKASGLESSIQLEPIPTSEPFQTISEPVNLREELENQEVDSPVINQYPEVEPVSVAQARRPGSFLYQTGVWSLIAIVGVMAMGGSGWLLANRLQVQSNQAVAQQSQGARVSAQTAKAVLAENTYSNYVFVVNSDMQVNGAVTASSGNFEGKLNSATLNTGFGDNELYPMDQPVATSSDVDFAGLSIGGVPVNFSNIVYTTQNQTLTNKTISGSNNTFSNIANSALSNSSITINTSGGLSGGGTVSLGGTISISGSSSSGVTSLTAGSGISLSGSTGDVTISATGGSTLPTGTNGQTLYNNAGDWAVTSNLFNDGTNVGIGTTDVSGALLSIGSAGQLTVTSVGTLTTSGTIATTGTGVVSSAGAFAGPTSVDTINGLIINTGAISGIIGYTQASGTISATGLTSLTQTLASGTAAITAPTLNLNTSSTGNVAIGNGTGTIALTFGSDQTGDIYYRNSGGTISRLAIGGSTQFLGVSSGVPAWASVSGGSCTNCLVSDPSANQPISPTGANTTGLSVRQTSTSLGVNTPDIFSVTNSAGTTKYLKIDYLGNLTATLNTTGSAVFSSTTAGADSIAILPQSSSTLGAQTGTLTSVDLTGNVTWTLPNTTGSICVVEAGNCAGSGTGVTTAGGTNNYLAKFTGAQSIGNSVVFDDGTNVGIGYNTSLSSKLTVNGNLGIGTTSALAPLDVRGNTLVSGNVGIGTTSAIAQLYNYGDTNGGIISRVENINAGSSAYAEYQMRSDTGYGSFFTNSSTKTDYAGASSVNFVQVSNAPLGFGTNNTLKMIILGDGNVGIGTATPLTQQHIYGSSTAGIISRIQNPNSGASAYAQSQIMSDTGNLTIFSNSSGKTDFGGAGSANIIQVSNTPLSLGTNNSVRMTIVGGGNIGIGTTNPEGNLTVYNPSGTGTITLAGSSGAARFRVSQGANVASGTIDLAVSSPKAGLFRSGSTNSFVYYDVTTGSTVINNVFGNTDSILFKHQETTMMTMNSSGNLGIGTTTPSFKLSVNGDVQVPQGNSFFLTSSGSGPQLFTDGGTDVTIYGVGGRAARFTTAGMTVRAAGSVLWSADTDTRTAPDTSLSRLSAGKLSVDTSTVGNSLGTLIAANVGIGTSSPANNLSVIGTGYYSGNVGIGTSVANKSLVVIGPSGGAVNANPSVYNGVLFQNTDNFALTLLANSNREVDINFGDGSNPQIGKLIYDNITDSMQFYVNAAEQVRINSSGNVGIGSTNPGGRLVAVGAGTTTGITFQTQNSSYAPLVTMLDNGNVGIGTTNPTSATFQVSGSGYFTGNVGIGSAPSTTSNLLVQSTFASGSNIRAVTLAPSVTTLDAGGTIYGLRSAPTISGASDSAGIIYALNGQTTVAGGVTAARSAGLYINDYSSTGTVTNNYGILLDNITKGSTNYAIYATGGQSYFGGNIGIGSTSPGYPLDVRVTAAASTAESMARMYVSDAGTGGIIFSNNSSTDSQFDPIVQFKPVGSSGASTTLQSSITAANDSGTTPVLIIRPDTTTGAITTRPLLAINNYTSTMLTVAASGNLGIGTTSPTNNLAVIGTGYFSGNVGIGSTNAGNLLGVYSQTSTYKSALMSTDQMVLAELEGGAYFGRVGLTENQWAISNRGVTWTQRGGGADYQGVAMSSNGKYITIAGQSDQIYTSSDYGVNWTARDSSRNWHFIAMSADGKIQAATVYVSGNVYMSYDYGATWTSTSASGAWEGVSMSSDGKYVTAMGYGGQIITSSNYGASWTSRDSSRNWYGTAMSSDGRIQTAGVYGGQIYTSTDYGTTWTARDSNRNWRAVAMSADGKNQTATVTGGQIYTSTDYGTTWTARDSNRQWYGIAMTSNGQYQTAIVGGGAGAAYTSSDYGLNWTAQSATHGWLYVAMSSDGKIQVAPEYGGYIYVSTADSYINTNGGNIGIGTTNPVLGLLQLESSAQTALVSLNNFAGTGSASNGINLAYGTSTTQAATTLRGFTADFSTNFTPLTGAASNLVGFRMMTPATFTESGNFAHVLKGVNIGQTPAITNSGTSTFSFKGYDIQNPGAVVQNTAAGTITWTGIDIQMPAITQTTGTVTSTGIILRGGTVTSGTAYALVTDSLAGNVGIGTTTPGSLLNVNGNVGIGTTGPNVTSAGRSYLSIMGSTARGVVELMTGQADADTVVVGQVAFTDKNSVNAEKRTALIQSSLDGATSNNRGGTIELWTRPDSGSLTARLVILGNGNVGIGSTNPGQNLSVTGTAGLSTGTLWTNTSDARVKQNIATIASGLDTINQLRPAEYMYRPEYLAAHPEIDNVMHYGFIAQEFQQVFPNSVTTGADGFLAVNQTNVIPYTVKAVQELNAKVDNIIANPQFSLDAQGNVLIPSAKIGKLVLDPTLDTTGTANANGTLSYRVMGLEDRVRDLENGVSNPNGPSFTEVMTAIADAQQAQQTKVENLQETVATQSAVLAVVSDQTASNSAQIEAVNFKAEGLAGSIASTSATLASLQEVIDGIIGHQPAPELNLTPPSVLTATGSAQLADLTVTNQTSTLKLSADEATISGQLSVLSEVALSKTTVAGDFVQDGSFSITDGKSINALPILYLQNSPLAEGIDLFNGKVTIDKAGVMSVEKLALSPEVLGTATIGVGTTAVEVTSAKLTDKSRVFASSDQPLSIGVVKDVAHNKFVLQLAQPALVNLNIDWWIVDQR